MGKVRVGQIAKELNIKVTEAISRLKELGIDAKSNLSTIEEVVANRLRSEFGAARTAAKAAQAAAPKVPKIVTIKRPGAPVPPGVTLPVIPRPPAPARRAPPPRRPRRPPRRSRRSSPSSVPGLQCRPVSLCRSFPGRRLPRPRSPPNLSRRVLPMPARLRPPAAVPFRPVRECPSRDDRARPSRLAPGLPPRAPRRVRGLPFRDSRHDRARKLRALLASGPVRSRRGPVLLPFPAGAPLRDSVPPVPDSPCGLALRRRGRPPARSVPGRSSDPARRLRRPAP
jgi:hypothetical protein